jgi:hypothetical protein
MRSDYQSIPMTDEEWFDSIQEALKRTGAFTPAWRTAAQQRLLEGAARILDGMREEYETRREARGESGSETSVSTY